MKRHKSGDGGSVILTAVFERRHELAEQAQQFQELSTIWLLWRKTTKVLVEGGGHVVVPRILGGPTAMAFSGGVGSVTAEARSYLSH